MKKHIHKDIQLKEIIQNKRNTIVKSLLDHNVYKFFILYIERKEYSNEVPFRSYRVLFQPSLPITL